MSIRTGIASIVMLALFGGPAFAQGVGGGVKGGVGYATASLDDDEIPSADTRTGIVVGGFVDIPAGGNLSVMVEGLFSQKGFKFSEGGFDATAEIDYVEVPVLLRGTFTPTRPVRPFVYAGVAPAFNTSATFRVEFDEQEEEEDFGDEIKPLDLGVVFGGGIRFGVMAIEARYNLGLLNVIEPEVDARAKNRQAAILVSVFFGGR